MGKSSFFSIFNIFKPCCGSSNRGVYSYMSDDGIGRRICPSDEDRGHWVAEPGIDRKASDFIARYYASRVSDPEMQTLSVQTTK